MAALRVHPRGREAFFVEHELTPMTAEALRNGMMSVVLDQTPEEQARRAMDLMLARIGLLVNEVPNPPIRFVIVAAENI
ncbi:putative LacI-family transcription regulator [Rubellimicrobium mesophilum DSM 19309]|uniref:Putative LacI-family transcription regulator n=1 Tax=Rubellimicrobium mesophilum DSM 19309 TaxID=442562 RepID=A0A017HQQ1_9RHOB|nr:hypothetical protein [Rubellimicrobium mesophilum]EYD76640.1 putative LacI-family transcription regulator [Rubellimicrobium mesophilum DSM 19309]